MLVAQLIVEGAVQLHLTIDGEVGIHLLHLLDSPLHLFGTRAGGGAEVGVAHHTDDGLLVEEAYSGGSELGNVDKGVGIGILVHQRIGDVIGALGRVDDMHGSEVLVFRTDTDDLVDYLDGIGVFCIKASDEGVSFACLDHHHTEVVAFEHLIIGLLEGIAVALTLLGEDVGITLTTFLFGGMAQIHDLNTFKR